MAVYPDIETFKGTFDRISASMRQSPPPPPPPVGWAPRGLIRVAWPTPRPREIVQAAYDPLAYGSTQPASDPDGPLVPLPPPLMRYLRGLPPGSDPDGPLVPLPSKPDPVRAVPDLPLATYRVMLR